MAGLIGSNWKFADYGGQQVRVDDSYKQDLSEIASKLGKSAMEFDKQINPSTYGARWGIPAPQNQQQSTQPQQVTQQQSQAQQQSQVQPQGLIGATIKPASNAEAVKALAKGYTATQVNVSPESTVQGQVNNIISSNSPLNQQAMTFADQQMNRRGLINSSMAVGAAQDALIKNALPIAQQDAATYANAGTFNAGAQNAASQFGAAAYNQAELQNAQLATNANLSNTDSAVKLQLQQIQSNTQMSIADKQAASNQLISKGDNDTKVLLNNLDSAAKMSQMEMDQETKIKIANLDSSSKQALAKIDADNKQLLQTNISAADMYRQYATALANISSSNQMNAEAKQQAINNQLNALNAGLDAIGETSGLNLSKYFESMQAPSVYDDKAKEVSGDSTKYVPMDSGGGGGD